ncbi:MAG: hypothetical protein IPJ84_02690 [Bdellovibrionales bacterium]|nr:hypothetical protein [Bdellovibrionales bacterium]
MRRTPKSQKTINRNSIATRAALCLLALSTSGLVACSATVTSDAPPIEIVSGTVPENPQSSAKAVQGSWRTGCQSQGGMYYVENMTIKERDVTMAIDIYSNSQCAGSPSMTQNLTGNFDVLAPSALAGAWEVDVTIHQSGQPSQTTKALVLVEGTTMFVSNDSSAPAGQRPTQVDRTKPYIRVGG